MMTERNSAELAAPVVPPAAEAPEDLVALAQDGDLRAFELLVRQNQALVLRTALHMLANREDARDAAQEVFIRMYSYLRNLKPGKPIEPWLYKITLNVCRDALRARARRAAAAVASPRPTAAQPKPEARERHNALLAALDTLSERERAAIGLRDFEGLSTKETARLLRVRQVTVRTLISRARIKLRRACDPEGGGS